MDIYQLVLEISLNLSLDLRGVTLRTLIFMKIQTLRILRFR